ncbi:MAG: hypothetical protein ABIE94_02795 [archaeon]
MGEMKKALSIFMGIIFLGAIWGILEATMGQVLHFIGLHPYTGVIMTSIGTGILAYNRKLYKARWTGIFIACIAAAFKAIDFVIPGSNVMRPIIAIIMIGVAFESVVYVLDKFKETVPNQAITGFATGYLSIATFAFITAYIIRYYYWLDKGFLGILAYLGTQGWTFAVGSSIAFLAGTYLVMFNNKLLRFDLERWVNSRPFYVTSGVFTLAAFIFVVVV